MKGTDTCGDSYETLQPAEKVALRAGFDLSVIKYLVGGNEKESQTLLSDFKSNKNKK